MKRTSKGRTFTNSLLCYLLCRKLLEKYSDYETKKTQLLHGDHPPSQDELDEIEDMITALEKTEAEKCRDVIARSVLVPFSMT